VAKRMLGDGRFLDIFHHQSYGKLTIAIEHIHGWREMPRPRKENDPTTTEGHRQMFVDMFALYPEVDFRKYDYIVAKMPGRGNFAFGERDDKAIPYRGSKIKVGVNIGSNSPGVLAHEVAHCMGLPDLYSLGEVEGPRNPMGRWDLMSSGGGASGFIGWQRHKLGWMDADRKTYLTKGSHSADLTPLDAKAGISMVVVPADDPKEPSVVFVAEIGQPPRPKKDEAPWPAGVLIYRIDATRPTGKHPAVIFPR
ncbi:MAG: immune inhibitor A domain-containing protein, partial [Verrucomicrobiota bacterium]